MSDNAWRVSTKVLKAGAKLKSGEALGPFLVNGSKFITIYGNSDTIGALDVYISGDDSDFYKSSISVAVPAGGDFEKTFQLAADKLMIKNNGSDITTLTAFMSQKI